MSVAVGIAHGLAFIHKELYTEGIAHGNLKSSNVLMDKNMDPCISEYGLMVVNSEPLLSTSQDNGSMDHGTDVPDYPFKADMYNFGVILLELLTGKLVQNDGLDLTTWVHSVVREEWTAEVFDKVLFAEGASEERMVNLLQVALKCINPSPEARKINTACLHQISICPYPRTSIYTPSSPSGSHMGWASNGAFFGLDSARLVKKEIQNTQEFFKERNKDIDIPSYLFHELL